MTENEGQKERIKRLISSLNITTKGFEMKCGLSNGYVSSIRKGIGYKAIEQISDAFPNVNIIWLLTGEGEMYLNECIEENKQRESIPNISPSAMLETLYNEAREEKNRLLAIIESQQEVIKNQSELMKKINVQREDSAICADVAGSDLTK
jgi:transcriptional regulator with XRE-family HTH domain